MLNIPNLITLFRLFLIPIFIYLMFSKDYENAVIVLLVSGFSDIIDGFIARKFNMITKFGAIFDPVVDKLMQLSGLALVALQNYYPYMIIVFFVVFIKEILMIIGGTILYKKNIVISANFYGKISTVVVYICIILGILCAYYDYLFYSKMLAVIVVVFSILALGVYSKQFIKVLRNS